MQPVAVPRTILALYDSTYDKETAFLPIHQIAEMPLNHLGLIVNFHDINEGLPPISEMRNIRGVLTWFQSDAMKDPAAFLRWADDVVDAGKRFVVIGDLSVSRDFQNRQTPLNVINRFWSRLGVKSENDWNSITYDWNVTYQDPTMVGFERARFGVLPAFARMKKIDSRARSYLVLRRGDDAATDNHLLVVSDHGAYVASGYMHFSTMELHGRQWYVNPFEFFRVAFATDDLPKPDTTTLSGRRIFYSHIDGDGWRNVTEILPYRKTRELSAYVIQKEILEKYPDFPITVAPIAADIDLDWYGTRQSLELARSILAMPNIEAGSHTYAHPLDWSSLDPAKPQAAPREIVQPANSGSLIGNLFAVVRPSADRATSNSRYQPLTYHDKPFDLTREIRGAVEFINRILPRGKHVELVQWSGDTLPFESALAMAREAGLRNLNGGDTRLDPEFQSYGWVSALSRQTGNERQIYASNSNENTYTNLWTDRFFGFKYLIRTLENTESPIRLKPHNVYYHMFSGEKLSSLLAVQENYKYAREKELAPITTSHYAAIADSFFTTEIALLAPNVWRISNRGRLNTIRFDHATLRAVDYGQSAGVVGERHHQGSLYVALDAEYRTPVIALRAITPTGSDPSAPRPYLVHGRWEVSGLQVLQDGFSFKARGFGAGELVWRGAQNAAYLLHVETTDGAVWERLTRTDSSGVLKLNLGSQGLETVRASVVLFPPTHGR